MADVMRHGVLVPQCTKKRHLKSCTHMKIGEAKGGFFMGFSQNSFHATSAKLQLQEANYRNTDKRNRHELSKG